MPFIGNQPAESYSAFQKQDFSTSATTSYTLDNPVANANELALFINFVRQEPTTAYSASGTSLTLTSATASSDDMYCVYLGKALQTVNPPNASVGTSQLVDGSITSAKLASGAVANTPAFLAYNASNQTISNNTWTKVVADTEVFDSDGKFASNRFTPTVNGKYYIFGSVLFDDGDHNNEIELQFYKNGSATTNPRMYQEEIPHGGSMDYTLRLSGIINLDSDDYVELFVKHNVGSDQVLVDDYTNFGGYKIIGA